LFNYLLTIDSLSLQLESLSPSPFSFKYVTENFPLVGNAYFISSRLQLRKAQILDKYYLHVFDVIVDSYKVATLGTDCRQYGNAASNMLAFENEVFYTSPGWFYFLRTVEQDLQLRYKSVSNMEIAFDFQRTVRLLPELCHIYRYSSYLKHNAEVHYAPLDGKTSCTPHHGKLYAFGKGVKTKGATGKQIAVYNKTDEIEENRHKPYILVYWAANGFDTTQPVERVESKLAAKWLNKYLIFPSDLDSVAFLGSLFLEAVGKTFTFRKLNEVTYDANRNKKTAQVTLIEFPPFDTQTLYKLPKNESRCDSDTRNRSEAKNLVLRFIDKGAEQDWLQLEHLRQSVKSPDNSNWTTLFRRYAQQFEGRTTPDRMARVELFG